MLRKRKIFRPANIPCTQPGCPQLFKSHSGRTRHFNAVHYVPHPAPRHPALQNAPASPLPQDMMPDHDAGPVQDLPAEGPAPPPAAVAAAGDQPPIEVIRHSVMNGMFYLHP